VLCESWVTCCDYECDVCMDLMFVGLCWILSGVRCRLEGLGFVGLSCATSCVSDFGASCDLWYGFGACAHE
jgi:hypothetical protein